MTSSSHRSCACAFAVGLPLQKMVVAAVGTAPVQGEFYWPTMVAFFAAFLFAPAPDFLNRLLGDRIYAWTHCVLSVPVAILVAVLVCHFSDPWQIKAMTVGFAIAWTSHIAMDSLGTRGCPVNPFRDFPRFGANLYFEKESSETYVVLGVAFFGVIGFFVFQDITWREWGAYVNIGWQWCVLHIRALIGR